MGDDPRALRAEIEETRERTGDTVDALAYKADVKTRARESVSEQVDASSRR
jgi:phage tail protein X